MLVTDAADYPCVYIVPEWPQHRLSPTTRAASKSYMILSPGDTIWALDGWQPSWSGRYRSTFFYEEAALQVAGYLRMHVTDYEKLEGVGVW